MYIYIYVDMRVYIRASCIIDTSTRCMYMLLSLYSIIIARIYIYTSNFFRKENLMERLTRTVPPPAVQSTRRFPRAKSDRHHQTLTYLVGPQHSESRRANFTSATAVVAAAKRRRVPLLSDYLLVIALTFSRALICSFLSRPAVRSFRFVRSSFARPPDRPRALHRNGGGGQTTRAYFYQIRLRSRCNIRMNALLATSGTRRVSRQPLFLVSRCRRHAQRFRPRDSHTLRAARTHNARTRFVMAIFGGKQLRAPTTRRGSLRRPASGTSLRGRSPGAPFSSEAPHFSFTFHSATDLTRARAFFSPDKCHTREKSRREHSREVALVREAAYVKYSATFA